MVVKTLDEMAAGGHVRPGRRRLPPLLGRRPLARAALREDALRQRAARARVPARLARHRRRPLPRDRRRDDRVHAARAAPARGRLRLGAGRGHGRRRGPDVHVDGGRGRAGRAARAVRARPLDHPRRARRRDARAAVRGSASSGRSRFATTRRSRPGTGSRSRRSPRPGAGSSGPDWVDAARRLGDFLLGPLSDADGRLRRSWRDGRTSGAGYLDDYANVGARAARAARRDRASCAGCTRRTGSRGSRSSSSPTTSTAASSSHPPTASSSSRGRRSSTTTRSRPATRCSRTCCCGSRGSTATTSSSAAASRCSGSLRPALERAPSAFGWALCALDLHLSPPRELAIVGPVDSDVARAALEPWQPTTVVAVGPADDVPLLAGKTSSTGVRPSTSASASPARRRSRMPAEL